MASSESPSATSSPTSKANRAGKTGRDKINDASRPIKRRCVSSACISCRKRKSKCDGKQPSCAACSSVYHTECVYDLNSDHRRKGVYKKDIDNLKTQNGTLQTLLEALLNFPEDKAFELVREIRSCDSLEDLAERIVDEQRQSADQNDQSAMEGDSPASQGSALWGQEDGEEPLSLETTLSSKMGALRLEEGGQVRFIGATSNLMLLPPSENDVREDDKPGPSTMPNSNDFPISSWTNVTHDRDLISHLMNLYFTYHYPFFTTLSKAPFLRDFHRGPQEPKPGHIVYCTPLLVNIMLALGCHFTSWEGARANPKDPTTAGDHFFREAKRLIFENDEHENPRLTTVQALALMSVREAGCGREARGWVYSGMSFRMAMDLGLHLNPEELGNKMEHLELDARRITFWGCFLFDKCWSLYMGRMPQLPSAMVTVPKVEVFPNEDSDNWMPYSDEGANMDDQQPGRIRAISLQISLLCEISNDILLTFYNPNPASQPSPKLPTKSTINSEFKKLSELFNRLEEWRKKLPAELDARGGSLPSTLLMHMFHQTLYIHLFRPFLKFSANATNNTGAPPLSHLDPRKACLGAANTISKYLRFYKHRYKLRQICNVAGYFIHTAATIHLLNLPTKTAHRDIIQSCQALEEMGECWLVARRSLVIIAILVRRWKIDIPEEAQAVLERNREEAKRWGLATALEGLPASPQPTQHLVPPIVQPQQYGYAQGAGIVYQPQQNGAWVRQQDQWLLRDQEGLGVDLQGLGTMGWEEGDVASGVSWGDQWQWQP
ncbi:Similar to Nitrogen assimilation transcription factor nit-4; acc. no. P28349 [Pyronema omphalodes CBS 100304]|uniref:Similar to Nitrogen assimilation transcription factor nit-4 acc. no. P28349 n=1 Tax=Pyronema omphalodes (strain CBS 100304) TaxID=1076935 RepID=U4LCN2_PYROM|nr:Similar to Nitrogen assimilation transcription factor nit-4; acc. no. P28349 [Pyronema omphalodes CBS 100304]